MGAADLRGHPQRSLEQAPLRPRFEQSVPGVEPGSLQGLHALNWRPNH
jgi:hypothetical protein